MSNFLEIKIRYASEVNEKGAMVPGKESVFAINKGLVILYHPSMLESDVTVVFVAGASGSIKALYPFEVFKKMMEPKRTVRKIKS